MFGRGGCGVLGALGWELASERVDWVAVVFWVLGCARVGGPGLCSELATAAARWRPRSSARMAWRGEGSSSARGSGSRGQGGDAWGGGAAGGGLRPPWAAAAPLCAGGRAKQRGREVEDEDWTCLQFLKNSGILL